MALQGLSRKCKRHCVLNGVKQVFQMIQNFIFRIQCYAKKISNFDFFMDTLYLNDGMFVLLNSCVYLPFNLV